MWSKCLIACFMVIITALAVPALAFTATTQAKAAMNGEATILPGTRTAQIQMALKSVDAGEWLINLSLNIPLARGEGDDGGEDDEELHEITDTSTPYNITGSFRLGVPARTITSGTITGTLNSNGRGAVILTGQNESTSLNLIFTITGSGTVTAVVEGQWPQVDPPVPPAAPAVIPPVSPSLPVPSEALQAPPTVVLPVPLLVPSTPLKPASHLFWYLSRTAAMAAYILLFINVCLGIGLKTKYLDSILQRWRTYDLHLFTALLGSFLVILHIFSLLGDSYFKFTFSDLFIPMSSPYKPLWTTLGIIAFYSGAVLVLSFYLRKIIKQKTWRVLHFVSFVLFFAVLFHGIKTGTDTSAGWVQWLYISTGTMVVFLSLWRFLSARSNRSVKRAKVPIASPE